MIALTIAGFVSAASAHEVSKGPNGGPVVDVAGHHIEMVAKGTEFVLYLTDAADKPLASAGTKAARAIVQDAGKTATVPLSAIDPNKLVGTLTQPLGAGARIVVSATLADGHALQARFTNN
jgi:cytoskeletal protein RodZ